MGKKQVRVVAWEGTRERRTIPARVPVYLWEGRVMGLPQSAEDLHLAIYEKGRKLGYKKVKRSELSEYELI